MVSDDTVRNAEPIDDVEEEFDRLFRVDVGDGLGLYLLGELVDRYEQVSEAARALFEGSYHVEAPDHEWPGDGDGLKLLCRQMSLSSVELASHTCKRPPLHLVAWWASKNLGERLFRLATSGPRDIRRF